MNKCLILVDNSNIFIGGQQHSAQQRGIVREEVPGRPPRDSSWRLNFPGLFEVLADGREVHAAIMVGSGPTEDGPVWDSARHSGFEVIVHERTVGRGEKAVDTELVARGTEIIATAAEPMTLVVASGDLDLLPLVEVARRYDWAVELAAFTNSFDLQGELAAAVDRVRPLDDSFGQIGQASEG